MAKYGPFLSSLRRPFLAVLRNLPKAPNDRQTLAALDSVLLPSAHLLDATSSLLLIRCLSASRKLTRAASLLSALRCSGAIPDHFLYSVVSQCLVPRGTTRDVESFWGDLVARRQQGVDADQKQPRTSDASASSFLIHLCRHCDDDDDAVLEIERVYRRISASRWPLSRQCYMALVGAFCRKRSPNPSLAVEVLRDMEEKGFEADELTYFVLFRCFCRAGKILEADSILRSMAERWNYELDVSLYEEFLFGLCKSGKLREARKLFDKLAKPQTSTEEKSAPRIKLGRRVIFQLRPLQKVPESVVFEMYFKALCNAGKADEAEMLLEEAMQKNVLLDNCVYSSFLEVLFQVGRSEDAIQFLAVERKKHNAAAVGEIAVPVVVGLCRMGRVDDGYKLLFEMEDGGFVPTAHVWNWILESYWKQGMVEEAMDLFQRMRAGSIIGSVRIDDSMYSTMVYGFLAKEDMKMAVNLVKEIGMTNMRANINLHKAVVRSLFAGGEVEESQKYLNKMVETGILASYSRWEKLVDTITGISMILGQKSTDNKTRGIFMD